MDSQLTHAVFICTLETEGAIQGSSNFQFDLKLSNGSCAPNLRVRPKLVADVPLRVHLRNVSVVISTEETIPECR